MIPACVRVRAAGLSVVSAAMRLASVFAGNRPADIAGRLAAWAMCRSAVDCERRMRRLPVRPLGAGSRTAPVCSSRKAETRVVGGGVHMMRCLRGGVGTLCRR